MKSQVIIEATKEELNQELQEYMNALDKKFGAELSASERIQAALKMQENRINHSHTDSQNEFTQKVGKLVMDMFKKLPEDFFGPAADEKVN